MLLDIAARRSGRPAARFSSPAPLLRARLIEDVAEATASESPATSAGAVRHAAMFSRRRYVTGRRRLGCVSAREVCRGMRRHSA